MPYQKNDGTFGYTISQVRSEYPNVSLPDGISHGDYSYYEESPRPDIHQSYTVFEIAPVEGKQQWGWEVGSPKVVYDSLMQELAILYGDLTWAISAPYPPTERESWPIQILEAQAFAAGGLPTPWLTAAAAARNMSVSDLVDRINVKDAGYRKTHGHLTGNRQRLEDEINAVKHDSALMLAVNVRSGWDIPG